MLLQDVKCWAEQYGLAMDDATVARSMHAMDQLALYFFNGIQLVQPPLETPESPRAGSLNLRCLAHALLSVPTLQTV